MNWYLPKSDYYTHSKYSAIDLLESHISIHKGEKPIVDPAIFKDKIVVIGLNADKNSWEQLSETPILKRLADMDVHSTMIDNMLNNDFFSIASIKTTLLITALFSLFIIFGFTQFKLNLIFATLLSFIYFIFYIVQYANNIYVQPITPIIVFYLTVVMKKIFKLVTLLINNQK